MVVGEVGDAVLVFYYLVYMAFLETIVKNVNLYIDYNNLYNMSHHSIILKS